MPTTDPHVQEVIRAAELQLQELMQQRADVTRRIGTIKQTLTGLANLFGDSVLSDDLLEFLDRKNAGPKMGFTRACRVVLMNSSTPLGARQVCDELRRRFAEVIARHKDPLASVTTVLNRLEEYGEARSSSVGNGRRMWEWVADHPRNGNGTGKTAAPSSTATTPEPGKRS